MERKSKTAFQGKLIGLKSPHQRTGRAAWWLNHQLSPLLKSLGLPSWSVNWSCWDIGGGGGRGPFYDIRHGTSNPHPQGPLSSLAGSRVDAASRLLSGEATGSQLFQIYFLKFCVYKEWNYRQQNVDRTLGGGIISDVFLFYTLFYIFLGFPNFLNEHAFL